MRWRWSNCGAYVGSLFLGLLLCFSLSVYSNARTFPDRALIAQSPEQSAAKLCDTAKRSTVKIPSGEVWGSGVLISQHGSSYSVVTNGHVLDAGSEFFTIQTPDDQQHTASLLVRFDHGRSTGNDLAILQFDSSQAYPVVQLAEWAAPAKILAAGFPLDLTSHQVDDRGFACTDLGEVFRRLDEPMQNGYQLGYFLGISHGMSGGPVLDEHEHLVGINGMSEPVVFVNPDIYLYRDGRRVAESLEASSPEEALDLLAKASWAIPAETMVYLAPEGLHLSLNQSG